MNYKAYKFNFKTGVHFGKGNLGDSEITFRADSLFSALCIETLKESQDELDKLVSLFSAEKLNISDAFPFNGDDLFLPKPCCYIERKETDNESSSVLKKQNKKLKYISVKNFKNYFNSTLNPADELSLIGNLGNSRLRTSAAINGNEETKPYSVGVYHFNTDCGLYIIVGYENQEDLLWLEDYLIGLSYTGIGGRRSSGLGKFELKYRSLPQELICLLGAKTERSMLISAALPAEEEMESSLENAEYSIIQRSGFVSSFTYSDTNTRKKDLFIFDSGSCFKNRFKGKIFDVSIQGNHPVYRYAIPMWIGV